MGGPSFWKKAEEMLQNDIKTKSWKLPSDEVLALLNALAIKGCRNEEIWQPLLSDMDSDITLGVCSNMDIFNLMRSLHAIGLLEDTLSKQLIEYIVKRGYDSDDLMKMSSKKGGFRRAV
jgi:hypothetical protein